MKETITISYEFKVNRDTDMKFVIQLDTQTFAFIRPQKESGKVLKDNTPYFLSYLK